MSKKQNKYEVAVTVEVRFSVFVQSPRDADEIAEEVQELKDIEGFIPDDWWGSPE